MTQPTPGSATMQVTLSGLLGWFATCCAFLAIMASGPAIWNSMIVDSASGPRRQPSSGVAVLCLSIILWPHMRRRQYGVVAAYTFIPTLVLLFTIDLQGGSRDGYVSRRALVLGALWLSTVVSFPLFSFRKLGQLVEREAQPFVYLVYNVAVAMVMAALLTVLASFFMPRQLVWPVLIFGAILGVWLGLHQAVTTSDRLAAISLHGLPLRAACKAGLIGAVVGPLIYCWLSVQVLGVFPFPMRYSPTLGFPAAVLAGLWFKSGGTRAVISRRLPEE